MLIAELRAARERQGLSRDDLADRTGLNSQAIKRLEGGTGTVPNLVATMVALDLHLAGIGFGSSLPAQLAASRKRRGMSISDVAAQANISAATVKAVERGAGTVASLLKIMTVLARDARRRQPAARAFLQLDPMNERDVRFTPPTFLQVIYDVFGEPDLDPCAHALSPVRAKRKIMLSEGGDGLRDQWSGSLVYMNPPFSALLRWLRRAEHQWLAQRAPIPALVAT